MQPQIYAVQRQQQILHSYQPSLNCISSHSTAFPYQAWQRGVFKCLGVETLRPQAKVLKLPPSRICPNISRTSQRSRLSGLHLRGRLVDALEWLVGLLHGLPEVMPPDFPWVMLTDLLATPEEAIPEPTGALKTFLDMAESGGGFLTIPAHVAPPWTMHASCRVVACLLGPAVKDASVHAAGSCMSTACMCNAVQVSAPLPHAGLRYCSVMQVSLCSGIA